MDQFRQLGFDLSDCLFDGLALKLFKMMAELFREQGFDMCLEARLKLPYFVLAQQTRQEGIGFFDNLRKYGQSVQRWFT